MKSRYKTMSLDELCEKSIIEIGRGKIISRKDLENSPGEYPVYSSSKTGDGRFGAYGEYMFDEELITWSIDGGGKLFYRSRHRFSVTNVGGYIRVIKTNEMSPKYLYYCLTFLHSTASFDWVKKAHPSVIRKIYNKIPLPPLVDQEKIAEELDKKLQVLNEISEVAERKIDRFSRFFILSLRKKFAFSSQNFTKKTIGDLLSLQRGFDITKKEQNPKGVPVVSSGGVKSFHDTAKVVAPGVVIGRKGSLGTAYYLEDDFWPHDTTLWVKDFKNNPPKLIYYLFKSLDVSGLDSGAANPALNRNNVHPLEVFWPKQDALEIELKEIEDLDLESHKLLALYEKKLELLDELKVSVLYSRLGQ